MIWVCVYVWLLSLIIMLTYSSPKMQLFFIIQTQARNGHNTKFCRVFFV